jgi:hypothetical protein
VLPDWRRTRPSRGIACAPAARSAGRDVAEGKVGGAGESASGKSAGVRSLGWPETF